MVTKRRRHPSHLLLSSVTLSVLGCALPEYDKVDQSPLPNEPIGIAAGENFSGVVFRGGQVKMWGANESGQLGIGSTTTIGDGPGEMSNALRVVNLGSVPEAEGPFRAAALIAGAAHVCALSQELLLKCWGNNSEGQLGIEQSGSRGLDPVQMADLLPFTNLSGGQRPVVVATGGLHTCAALKDGKVKCWGNNEFGQLGLGDTNDRGIVAGSMGSNLPAVIDGGVRSIAAGEAHTCAILANGNVKCWGKNDAGQLGLGDTNNRGDQGGEMAHEIDLGPGARSIAAGGNHTCVVLDDDTVKCWGLNNLTQTGNNDAGNNVGDAPDEVGPGLTALGLGRPAQAVAAGTTHTCALLDNGQIKCWGQGNLGQAGRNQVPDLGNGRSATAIAAGGTHTCAVLDDASVKCWGNNQFGQLGTGNTSSTDVPRTVDVGNPG